jgi:hypothetical protein
MGQLDFGEVYIDLLNSGLLVQSINRLMVGSLSTSAYGRPAIRHLSLRSFIAAHESAAWRESWLWISQCSKQR